jgi:hypothetical protein
MRFVLLALVLLASNAVASDLTGREKTLLTIMVSTVKSLDGTSVALLSVRKRDGTLDSCASFEFAFMEESGHEISFGDGKLNPESIRVSCVYVDAMGDYEEFTVGVWKRDGLVAPHLERFPWTRPRQK